MLKIKRMLWFGKGKKLNRENQMKTIEIFAEAVKFASGQVQLASANLAKSLKNSFFGVEKPSFFLGLKFSFFATLRT